MRDNEYLSNRVTKHHYGSPEWSRCSVAEAELNDRYGQIRSVSVDMNARCCGEAVKPCGGKGGGTKEFAQGSVPEEATSTDF